MNVYYGGSNDVNMCNDQTFEYSIVGGVPVYKNQTTVTFNLTNTFNSKTPHDISMTIGFFDTGILNIKWTWADQSVQRRVPVSVPHSVINTTPKDNIQDNLGKYVVLMDKPFSIQINTRLTSTPEPVLTLKSLIFNDYINWVNM